MAKTKGYYYNPQTKMMDFGEAEGAFPSISQAMRNRYGVGYDKYDTGVADFSGPIEKSFREKAMKEEGGHKSEPSETNSTASAISGAKELLGGGDAASILGSGLTASGNPYAAAAGLALKTAGAINRNRYEQKLREYNSLQEGLSNAIGISKGLRV